MTRKYLALLFVLFTSLMIGCSKGQSSIAGNGLNQQEQTISLITSLASGRPNIHPKTKEGNDAYNAYLEKEKILIKDLIGKKVENWSCTAGESSTPIDLTARLAHVTSQQFYESKFDCFGNKDHRTSGITEKLDNQIFSILLNENDARKIGKLNKGDQVKFSGTIFSLNLGLRTEFIMEFHQAKAELIK